VGADLPGGSRAPQRGSFCKDAAGWHLRHLQWRPTERPHSHGFPGQVCAAQTQGMHCVQSQAAAIITEEDYKLWPANKSDTSCDKSVVQRKSPKVGVVPEGKVCTAGVLVVSSGLTEIATPVF